LTWAKSRWLQWDSPLYRHLFPVYFRYKGGKGVSTAAGILLALDVRIAGVALFV